MSDNQPRKRKMKAGKAAAAPKILGYVTLHETNLALCMASGFLSARHEPIAAIDHHSRTGQGVVLSGRPVPAEHMITARGDLDYGAIAILEISQLASPDGAAVSAKEVRELPAPIPLAFVRRVLFKSEAESRGFLARSSGYGDIPMGVVEVEVDAAAFPPSPSEGNLFVATLAPPLATSDPVESGYDKTGGVLATVISALRLKGGDYAAGILERTFVSVFTSSMPVALIEAIANELDPGGGRKVGTRLARLGAEVLARTGNGVAFNALTVLEEVSKASGAEGSEKDNAIETFVRHAADIVSMRREIDKDSFSDAPGKIAPRAFLLFLLNPDPDRLMAVAKRVPHLGGKVFTLASALVGCHAGLAGLPGALKAPDRQCFLGLGLVAYRLCRGEKAEIAVTERWDERGTRHSEFVHDGYHLLSQESSANRALIDAFSIAEKSGIRPSFNANSGQLSFADPKLQSEQVIEVRLSKSPTFPREDSLQLCLFVDVQATKIEVAEMAADISSNVTVLPVFAKLLDFSKVRRIELSTYCTVRLLSESSLRDAIQLLAECRQGLSKVVDASSLAPRS